MGERGREGGREGGGCSTKIEGRGKRNDPLLAIERDGVVVGGGGGKGGEEEEWVVGWDLLSPNLPHRRHNRLISTVFIL